MNKTCVNCGTKIPEGASFCTSCGRPVSLTAPLQVTPYREQPLSQQDAPPQVVLNRQESTLPPPPPPLSPQPMASMLMYLFADRLFEEGGFIKGKMKVPCKDVTVAAWTIMEELFAVTFWSLRERGIVRLEAFQARKLLVIPTTRIRVIEVNQAERPGLEGVILNILSGREDDDVYHLLKRWFGGQYHRYQLLVRVVGVPAQEAVAFGYIGSRTGKSVWPVTIQPRLFRVYTS